MESLVVAVLLALVPYLVLRGPFNHLAHLIESDVHRPRKRQAW
jgi:hypothetical protein